MRLHFLTVLSQQKNNFFVKIFKNKSVPYYFTGGPTKQHADRTELGGVPRSSDRNKQEGTGGDGDEFGKCFGRKSA